MFLEMLNKLLGLRSVNNRQPNAFILIFCLKAFFLYKPVRNGFGR